jgi:hypothetical protein
MKNGKPSAVIQVWGARSTTICGTNRQCRPPGGFNAKTETLHNAAAFGREAMVRILLEKGADVNALATTCETEIWARSGDSNVVGDGSGCECMKIRYESG